MYSKYFAISDIKDGMSSVYKINYNTEEELIKKIVFITLAPEINRSMTLDVTRVSKNTYWIYVKGQTIIRVNRLDGRKVAKTVEYKYSSTPEDIDMQYNREVDKYKKLHINIKDGI